MFFYSTKRNNIMQFFCTIIGAYYRLWDYEVVEIFFLSSKDNMYLEVEFGPHGHHLGLLLKSRQKCIKHSFPIDYTAKIGRHTVFFTVMNIKKGQLLILFSRLAIYSYKIKMQRILKSCESFLRKSQFSTLTILADPGTC